METILVWGVTKGSGSNIGKQVAKYFNSIGYNILLAGRDDYVLKNISADLGCKEPFVTNFPIDGKRYVEYLEHNNVTAVISFIGKGYSDNTLLISEDKIAEMIEANVNVPIDIVRKSFTYLKTIGGSGKIIVANSIAGFIAEEGSPIYSCTKFALRGYIDSLKKELGNYKKVYISSLFFQNINRCGIDSIYDCIETSLRNECNFDFIIN